MSLQTTPRNSSSYAFLFRGGSCGSFVKLIWHYYLCKINNKRTVGLFFNNSIGDAHNSLIDHFHDVASLRSHKDLSSTKVVLVSYELDDVDLMAKMQYYKVDRQRLDQNLDFYTSRWPELTKGLLNPETKKDVWINQIKQGHINWLNELDTTVANFIIDFKTVYGLSNTNLNLKIANFLNTDPSDEVAEYIENYRLVNHKLYGKN